MANLRLPAHQRKLLSDLGLTQIKTLPSSRKRIEELRLRDLDRLKMIFIRLIQTVPIFPVSVIRGIKRNDLDAFAQAALIISKKCE